eukprot:CAMPEP_0201587478 /NCGR_PEP_ID=MMETSP0190_2-20130828/144214_1 /ASSEMBLY_ACC=CAM_ASM_000263 /TAXON_ID=37353 /ORGANISM="Rosalina sp." /LENGTH=234 /DNA_ID=CAMNT_0048037575 /DNA_START=25 /DNA_END=729 /DNA_ORIENTATION=-
MALLKRMQAILRHKPQDKITVWAYFRPDEKSLGPIPDILKYLSTIYYSDYEDSFDASASESKSKGYLVTDNERCITCLDNVDENHPIWMRHWNKSAERKITNWRFKITNAFNTNHCPISFILSTIKDDLEPGHSVNTTMFGALSGFCFWRYASSTNKKRKLRSANKSNSNSGIFNENDIIDIILNMEDNTMRCTINDDKTTTRVYKHLIHTEFILGIVLTCSGDSIRLISWDQN